MFGGSEQKADKDKNKTNGTISFTEIQRNKDKYKNMAYIIEYIILYINGIKYSYINGTVKFLVRQTIDKIGY